MLQKDPSKRPTTKELKKEPWINFGQKVNLDQDGANMLDNVTDQELQKRGLNEHQLSIA